MDESLDRVTTLQQGGRALGLGFRAGEWEANQQDSGVHLDAEHCMPLKLE